MSSLGSRIATLGASRALQACNVYVSEGQNKALISHLKSLTSRQHGAVLVNVFVDEVYNRTGFTLASRQVSLLADTVVALAKGALEKLDLRQHLASHPRVGVVDHISCHPLTAAAELHNTAALAKRIGEGMGSGRHAIPVFLYGGARDGNPRLADIRRCLGYFDSATSGLWEGGCLCSLGPGVQQPDFGPREVDPAAGVVLVGATPWVTNYNIPLHTSDMAVARRVAKAVSERGGGLLGVEAMALRHGQGIEVACNLLRPEEQLLEEVKHTVEKMCTKLGIKLGHPYRIGKSASDYANVAFQILDMGGTREDDCNL